MVFDTSVLIEILFATDVGNELIDNILNNNIKPYTTTLNITEALYVTCRLLGMREARKRIELLLNSGYFKTVSSDNVNFEAAECKCKFPISIVDCHTLALARKYEIPVLFYRLEEEFKLVINEIKAWINNEIYFLVP